MKLASALGIAVMFASLAVPAAARTAFVQDDAGMFGSATVSTLNQTIATFNQQTGKEVVVVSVPSLAGKTIQQAAEDAFAQQQVNGVLIFLAKAEKKDGIIGDRASQAFFPPGTFASIRDAMRGYFRSGDFDTGIVTGVNLVLDQYRSHERALGTARTSRATQPLVPTRSSSSFGGLGLFWLIVILLVGFLIIRALFRALSGPRMMPPGYGPGAPGPGPGYGYGPGGYGGGGGGFFSGLLGGLGGAFLGNELFRGGGGGYGGGDAAGIAGGGAAPQDAAGWQSDAGQADTGNASFGDFGDSGGGFDAGGGGGGDSGGGW